MNEEEKKARWERAFQGLAMTTWTTGVTAATWVTAPSGMSTTRKSGIVFAGSVMGRGTRVSMLIVRRVCTKAGERLLTAFRHRSVVAVTRIVALVDVTVKSMMPVEPWAGADEYPASKPVRAVVAIGCTVIRSIREIAVGAHWSHTDVDRHLRRCA
jgi:hypothetical protein